MTEHTMNDNGAQMRRDLRKTLRRAQDRFDAWQYAAQRRARRGMRAADHLAREHPWQTAGAAVTAGVVLGAVLALVIAGRGR